MNIVDGAHYTNPSEGKVLLMADKKGMFRIDTELFDGRIEDKFEPVVRGKMQKYPSEILGVTICDDNLEMIVEAAKDFINKGAELLIFSGGHVCRSR